MTNPFYDPSGNPGTGSEGLSALIRQEFIAIGEGFDALPAFLTTGAYTTTFNQKGVFTFDLPGFPGTLATLADVDAEATRALAAEGANTTAIDTEVTARTAAVASEVTRATAAEGANATAIATETNRATAAEGTNATAIATETTNRTTAITAEATARTAAISAEATARTAAIAVETAARTTAISTEATTRATAIAAETTRAEAAEAALTLFENTHDETGTRSPGTTYTNSTGKPMVVSITITIFNTGPDMNFYVNNTVTVKLSRLNGVGTAYAIVPDGATYKTDPNTGTNWQGSITTWVETW